MSSTVTSTSITVVWEEIGCIDRNGRITSYDVTYGVLGEAMMTMSNISERSFTADDPRPFTSYTFQVRGVNSVGSGPYSAPKLLLQQKQVIYFIATSCMYVSLCFTPQLLVLCSASWVHLHLLQ